MSFERYAKSRPENDIPALNRPVTHRADDPATYIPSDGLVTAVNVALALGKPLLVTGEPGTGKTQLAAHVARFFGLEKPIEFNAQTTSSAKDLFYRYDALGHFQYVQTQKNLLSPDEIEANYIQYDALGRAIRDTLLDPQRKARVVLIDEIDKAPRDLPNDVLAAIDQLRFDVPEIRKSFPASADAALKADEKPIIILTSNSEKNLPDAFLRRVVYFHIEFPGPEALLEILQAKFKPEDENTPPLFSKAELDAIIRHFNLLRQPEFVRLRKKPATAELIFWAELLPQIGFDPLGLDAFEDLDTGEKLKLLSSYAALAKIKEDHDALRRVVFPEES